MGYFLPLLIIYIRVVKLHPGMNIYDIMVTLFGKQVGKLLTLAMTLTSYISVRWFYATLVILFL